MNRQTRDFISTDILSISEVAQLLNIPLTTAMKRAERGEWEHVRKGRQKLYWRGDIVPRFPSDRPRFPSDRPRLPN